jgi:hypothetical protein
LPISPPPIYRGLSRIVVDPMGRLTVRLIGLPSQPSADLDLFLLSQSGYAPLTDAEMQCRAQWNTRLMRWTLTSFDEKRPNLGPVATLVGTHEVKWGDITFELRPTDHCPNDLTRFSDFAQQVPIELVTPEQAAIRWDTISKIHHTTRPVHTWDELALEKGLTQEQLFVRRLSSLLSEIQGSQRLNHARYCEVVDYIASAPERVFAAPIPDAIVHNTQHLYNAFEFHPKKPTEPTHAVVMQFFRAVTKFAVRHHGEALPTTRMQWIQKLLHMAKDSEISLLPLKMLSGDGDHISLSIHQFLTSHQYVVSSIDYEFALRPTNMPIYWIIQYSTTSPAQYSRVAVILPVLEKRLLSGLPRDTLFLTLRSMPEDVPTFLLCTDEQAVLTLKGLPRMTRVVKTPADLLPQALARPHKGGKLQPGEFPKEHTGFFRDPARTVTRGPDTVGQFRRFALSETPEIGAIYSIRKSGKSTFAVSYYWHEARQDVVYINAESCANVFADVLSGLIPLDGRVLPTIITAANAQKTRDPAACVFSANNRLTSRAILILDEVEALRGVVEAVGRDAGARLAVLLRDLSDRYRVVFIGLNPWWHLGLFPDTNSITLASPLNFPLFDLDETRRLAARIVEGQLEVTNDYAEWLLGLSGGHPLVVRNITLEVLAYAIQKELKQGDVLDGEFGRLWHKERRFTISTNDLLGQPVVNFLQKMAKEKVGDGFRQGIWKLLCCLARLTEETIDVETIGKAVGGVGAWRFDDIVACAHQTNFVVVNGGGVRLAIPIMRDVITRLTVE